MRLVAVLTLTTALAGCGGSERAHVNDRVKFSTSSYGAASPRVTRSRNVRRGGGRRVTGKPYAINGRRYRPQLEPGYDRLGTASWYGPNFHGRKTANGEIYDQYALSAAHPTMPLPSYARVTNMTNGLSTIVRVNDRGPYHSGRMVDLSGAAAKRLKFRQKGTAKVRLQYIGPAPLHGRDRKYLARSARSYDPAKLAASAKRKFDRRSLGSRFILAFKSKRAESAEEGAIAVALAP